MQMMKSPKEMSSMELPQGSDEEAEFDEEGEPCSAVPRALWL
jgi:hypothetical protein